MVVAGRQWPNVVLGRTDGDGRTGSFSDFVLGKFRMSFTVGNAVLALLLTAVGSTVFLISRNFLSRARGSGSGDFLSSFNIGVSIVRMLKVSNMSWTGRTETSRVF